MTLTEDTKSRFAHEVAKFPAEQRQSAVMACLAIVQQQHGWVSAEAEQAVAAYLGMPPIAVREVTTFYNMYNQQPVGRYKLNVCTNLPCQLRDGQLALDHVCHRLGIEEGGACSQCRRRNAWVPAPTRRWCWSTTVRCSASCTLNGSTT
jgi:NADH-quinone oxidoreductase subunit E